jgi:hypothetical protein
VTENGFPVGTIEGTREPSPATAPPPFGPDWTRGEEPSPDDRKEMALYRAAAFGRAKGKFLDALVCSNLVESDDRISALILQLVDWAIEGADIRTILNGLT